jgi:hypothetical protein
LAQLARDDDRYLASLRLAAKGERLRDSAWPALPDLDESARRTLAGALVDTEAPNIRTGRLMGALSGLSADAQPAFAEFVLAAVLEGRLDAEEAADSWPDALRREAFERSDESARAADDSRAAIEQELDLGERAYLAELREQMEPIINRASARAAGNARLEAGYGRLAAALGHSESEPVVTIAPTADLPDSISAELVKLGARPESSALERITFDASGDTGARIRYLSVLDQRAHRAGSAPDVRAGAARVLPAYADALGAVGLAERILRDLFDGGPLLPVAVQLSSATRALLLKAAHETGFEPPAAWLAHAALGEWLRAQQLDGSVAGSAPDDVVDAAALAATFRIAQDAAERLRAAREQLERQRHNVKEEVARAAADVFAEIDALVDSYAQLWQGFSRLGIQQIAPPGLLITRDELEPTRHEVVGDGDVSRFVVRSPGLEVDGEVVVRARVEGAEN